MGHVSYERISIRKFPQRPRGGFRLRTRRLCVNWLRVRFFYLVRFFCKWKFSCDHFTRILVKRDTNRKSICSGDNNSKTDDHNNSNNTLKSGGLARYSSYDHLNTFYSEAISECLEYIKLSSAISAVKNSDSAVAAPSSSTTLNGKD